MANHKTVRAVRGTISVSLASNLSDSPKVRKSVVWNLHLILTFRRVSVPDGTFHFEGTSVDRMTRFQGSLRVFQLYRSIGHPHSDIDMGVTSVKMAMLTELTEGDRL